MIEAIERDSMQYDVVIVGAGPSGLSAAIRLKQLAQQNDREISVCIVEKGSEVGAHILSGAVIDPKTLTELLPNWQEDGAPLTCAVKKDQLLFLTKNKSFKLPTPPSFQNEGNYIVSLGLLCRWLAEQAENLGVEIYPGFAASDVLYHQDGSVRGIVTGDMGINKKGEVTEHFQAGMMLLAQQTIFAEGCRGSLSKKIIEQFKLDQDVQPQTYGLGIKEIWEIDEKNHQQGLVLHSVGWPMDSKTYGGSFIYHLEHNQVAVGFVVGLDYRNPYLSPFEEFQRFKTHPSIKKYFVGGRRIAYGARALVEGGYQSIPKLHFAGGVLVGDGAGFLNVPCIKGIHTAMKSAILAAEAIFNQLEAAQEVYISAKEATDYSTLFQKSWLKEELYAVRNIRPAFDWGMYLAFAYGALDQYILRGKTPWTLQHRLIDNLSLFKAKEVKKIEYPKADNVLTFDRITSLVLSNVNHEEDQPCHLQLQNPEVAITINYDVYASPESRYCPAAVYEIVTENNQPVLQINAQNCIHCKTCDIKDPSQNINWQCPEGGGGPNYSAM